MSLNASLGVISRTPTICTQKKDIINLPSTMATKPTIIAGTLQSDPRSGGIKKSSGVKVLPEVAEAWEQVRDNGNNNVDWLIASYDNGSKTDITVIAKGNGGVEACAAALPENEPAFGGCRLSSGRFKSFYYMSETTSPMKKGRAGMHMNGVLNVLVGCDGNMKMEPGATEADA